MSFAVPNISPCPLLHNSHINTEPMVLHSPIILSSEAHISTLDDLALASTASQKTIAPTANNYTPPSSQELETEITTLTTTIKNLQIAKKAKTSKFKSNDKLTALPTVVKKSMELR